MNRRGIQEPFWFHATRKAGIDQGNASTLSRKPASPGQVIKKDDDIDVLPPPPSTKVTQKNEPSTNAARNIPPCSTYSLKQPRTTEVEGKSPKRVRTHSTGESEASNFIPPENPCFVDSSDVGRMWYYSRRNNRRHKNRSIPFKVVTYNVLADVLLQSHPALYEDCCGWCLEWEYRKKNLLKEILHYNADILCLQEVEEQHYENWFKPELQKAGYQGIFKKRTGNKVDGCATFYKESRFRIITHRSFEYRRENVPLMDRDNVALLMLLYPRYQDGGTCHTTALCVVNTHLLFNKNRGDIKLLQLACLFAEIDKLKKEYLFDKGRPQTSIMKIVVVLSGDFNTLPFSALYHYILNGYLNYKGMNKKALSGQNLHHHLVHSGRDIINGNIVPLELGLSHLSIWDKQSVQDHEDKAGATSSSHANSIFAEDDFGAVNSRSGWQEYGSNFHAQKQQQQQQCSTFTTFSAMLQTAGSSNAALLLAHQQGSYRYHIGLPFGPATTHQLGTSTTCTTSCQQYTSSGNRETPLNLGQGVGLPPRYCLPPQPPNPKHNPKCTILQHKLHFYSVYRHFLPDRVKEVTTYHGNEPSCTVDYIYVAAGKEFACGSCRQKHAVLELTGSLRLLSEEQISLLGGLPNPKLSSDHLSLVAAFVLHV